MSPLAILAYGSLNDDPGPELKPLIRDRKTVQTPFPVEYARASVKRGGAPTLVPTPVGAAVNATLLILDSSVTPEAARNILWRRETRRTDGTYDPPDEPTVNHVLIDEHRNLGGVALVISARIGPNIPFPSADDLARRAIASVRATDVADGKDGISYLIRAKSSGIETPLTAGYERAILDRTGARTLDEAITIVRHSRLPK